MTKLHSNSYQGDWTDTRLGSRPESPGFGETGEWTAKNFTEKEWDTKINRPKKKVGLPDQREAMEAFRSNYDKIDWSK